MLNVIVFATLVGQLPTPYPPDESDLLRGADQHPMINLLLDVSCSMNDSSTPTPCTDYATRHAGSPAFNTLDKNQMMEASLVGCRTRDDGVIARWNGRASFAVRFFGDSSSDETTLEATFGSSRATLEDAVLRASADGWTPMSIGLVAALRDFNDILTSQNPAPGGRVTSLQCRRNFTLLLSDGEPNQNAATANSACSGREVNVPSNEPWVAANYGVTSGDMLCAVDSEQLVGTYTIGFGMPGDFNPDTLRAIATQGQGRYYYATNVDSLNRAFEQIILSIAERAAVYGGGGTVQRQGLFSGGVNYIASYRTVDGGAWVGNLKRVCVTPREAARGPAGEIRYDTTDTSCMLVAIPDPTDGRGIRQILLPNATPRDQYSGRSDLEADRGGAGALMRSRITSGINRDTPTDPRSIYTYFPEVGTPRYVSLDIPTLRSGAITDANLWIPSGDTWKIVNRLNGFTYDNDNRDGRPTGLALWPMGDMVHASPVLLRYGDGCNAGGECFVVMPTNNGVVHIVDALTGAEASALVPGELWRPTDLTHHRLADLERQPTFETSRRHYIDGPAQLFHRDANGDGLINAPDVAYLIFGLGRGGRVYYAMDVSSPLVAGRPPAPLHPIGGFPGTVFGELRDSWSNPWLGRVDFGGAPRNVAIFASGHMPEHDRSMSNVPRLAQGATDVSITSITCDELARLNGLPSVESCGLNVPTNPGLDIPIGPFLYPDAIAYRVQFTNIELRGSSDAVYVTDGVERWASVVGGSGGTRTSREPLSAELDADGWSQWVYGTELFVRLVSEAGRAVNIDISNVEIMTATRDPDVQHYPTVYVVGLDGGNGWLDESEFNGRRTPDSLLARFARNCRVDGLSPGTCIDAATSPGLTDDLAHMTCPVSTEVSVVSFSNEMRLYWGDECGQIFVATNPSPERARRDWTVRRLAHLSWGRDAIAPSMINQATALGLSRDVRKIFRRLDIVASTCPGSRVYGVYFGTGDVQRPLARVDATVAADRYLQNADLAMNGRDIVGVIYDNNTRRHVTQRTPSFLNATGVDTINAVDARVGWYLELGPSEKMLRDPLVFQNVAYFKTFEPSTTATECEAGSGVDRVYAVNSCNAAAVVDTDRNGAVNRNDRVTSTGSEDIGPDPYVITPPGAPPIVVASGPMAAGPNNRGVFQRANTARPRIYNWRLPR